MAEELQGLLERIHEEGVKKADDEKEKILAEAKKEAESIVAKAKDEAESIRKTAEEDAATSESRAKAAIQQAARDIVLSLKQDLLDRLDKLVKSAIGETMTPEFMGEILMKMVDNYLAKDGESEPGVEILINQDDLEKMKSLLSASLAADLKTDPEISIGHDFSSGLKIGFKGNDVFFDFTDDAISDLICSFIGPKLAELLDKKTEGDA